MSYRTVLTELLIAALLAGCAAKGRTKRPADSPVVDSYSGPVCFLPTALPAYVKATAIGKLIASKRWYGGTTEVLQVAADEARKSGADVVTNVKAGHRIGALAWARPVATGESYRLDEGVTIDCVKLGGTLR